MNKAVKVYLSRILSENRKLLLEGIGILRLKYSSAQFHSDESSISPPREQVYFEPEVHTPLDPVLVRVVELVHGQTTSEARKQVSVLMHDLRQELDEWKSLSLPQIGVMHKSKFGDVSFKTTMAAQQLNPFFGLPVVNLPPRTATLAPESMIAFPSVHRGEATTDASNKAVPARQKGRSRSAWGFIFGAALLIIGSLTLYNHFTGDTRGAAESQFAVIDDAEKRVNVAPIADSVEKDATETQRTEEDHPTELISVFSHAIIVGAFGQQTNVDRMIAKLEEMGLEAYYEKGTSLTKVGFKTNQDALTEKLTWARTTINADSWSKEIRDDTQ